MTRRLDVMDSDVVARRTDPANEESKTDGDPLTHHKEVEQSVYNGYEEDTPEPDTT